jgi:hypothetical protein
MMPLIKIRMADVCGWLYRRTSAMGPSTMDRYAGSIQVGITSTAGGFSSSKMT